MYMKVSKNMITFFISTEINISLLFLGKPYERLLCLEAATDALCISHMTELLQCKGSTLV